jgi:hypothetical protein
MKRTDRMALSLRGIARRYNGVTGGFSVAQTLFGGTGSASLRGRLEAIARQQVGFAVTECIFGWTAAYEQTWSHVVVRIQLNPDAGIANQVMANLRATWANGITGTWSNRWSIGRAGEITLPLTFEVQWNANNPHHTVRVSQVPGGTNMTLWHTQDAGNVAAHEFGHMIGNPDEYTDARCPGRNPVNTGTVMDNNSNVVPQRLVQRLATDLGSVVI